MAVTFSSVASTSLVELNTQNETNLKVNSDDVGWQYAVKADPLNSDKLKCLLCNKVCSGGIFRNKQHIVNIKGNVGGCKLRSDEDKAKCLKALEDLLLGDKSLREEVVVQDDVLEIEDDETRSRKRKFFGLMDRYVSSIDLDSSLDQSKKSQQINISIIKERAHKVN
ncbi:unnamed protein product [Rhodiola kirilowii]